jgi:hypothetical protein
MLTVWCMEEKTIAHLTEALTKKKKKIAKLKARIAVLEEQQRGSRAAWSLPVQLPDEQTLPVPRLELVWTIDNECPEQVANYRLVHRIYGKIVGVALHRGSRYGYSDALVRDGKVQCLIRVPIAQDAAALNLPAYLICGDTVTSVDAAK